MSHLNGYVTLRLSRVPFLLLHTREVLYSLELQTGHGIGVLITLAFYVSLSKHQKTVFWC